jgi:hypothetical protein
MLEQSTILKTEVSEFDAMKNSYSCDIFSMEQINHKKFVITSIKPRLSLNTHKL